MGLGPLSWLVLVCFCLGVLRLGCVFPATAVFYPCFGLLSRCFALFQRNLGWISRALWSRFSQPITSKTPSTTVASPKQRQQRDEKKGRQGKSKSKRQTNVTRTASTCESIVLGEKARQRLFVVLIVHLVVATRSFLLLPSKDPSRNSSHTYRHTHIHHAINRNTRHTRNRRLSRMGTDIVSSTVTRRLPSPCRAMQRTNDGSKSPHGHSRLLLSCRGGRDVMEKQDATATKLPAWRGQPQRWPLRSLPQCAHPHCSVSSSPVVHQ